MKPAEIVERVTADGLTLSVSYDGKVTIIGDQDIINNWLEVIRENKSAILFEMRGQRVMEALERDAEKKYAFIVDDANTDPVLVTVAIKGIGSFDLEIPQIYYDGLALLEVIEQHTDAALDLGGDTYPLPEVKECSTGLPDERRNAA